MLPFEAPARAASQTTGTTAEVLTALDELDRAAANDGKDHPYGTPDCNRQERRLHDALTADFAARDEMIRLIGEAAGVEFGEPDDEDAEGPVPLATAREGRDLYLVVADGLRHVGLRPVVVEGVFR